MKPIGQLDTTHAMYQPDKRAKRGRRVYERVSIEYNGIVPDPHGSQAQREAWMRERQSRIGSEREKLRLPNPPREIQQRWIDEGEK